jgi:hypothetical protein
MDNIPLTTSYSDSIFFYNSITFLIIHISLISKLTGLHIY